MNNDAKIQNHKARKRTLGGKKTRKERGGKTTRLKGKSEDCTGQGEAIIELACGPMYNHLSTNIVT
jgi:hypothetical protein